MCMNIEQIKWIKTLFQQNMIFHPQTPAGMKYSMEYRNADDSFHNPGLSGMQKCGQ